MDTDSRIREIEKKIKHVPAAVVKTAHKIIEKKPKSKKDSTEEVEKDNINQGTSFSILQREGQDDDEEDDKGDSNVDQTVTGTEEANAEDTLPGAQDSTDKEDWQIQGAGKNLKA